MNPKYVSLRECKDGEILYEDLYDKNGLLIVAKDTILNSYIIDKLIKHNIDEVPVYIPNKDFNKLEREKAGAVYEESVLVSKKVMNSLASGETVDSNELKIVSGTLYDELMENGSISSYMWRINNADEYTYNHSVNVALYSLFISRWLGYSQDEIKNVIEAGLLHDVGKLKIPHSILNKKGRLTTEEYEVVKTHTSIGYELSAAIPNLDEGIREAILCHHEREDGSGYPKGIKGSELNDYSKIIAVADVYDALTSERTYKKKVTPFQAIEIFRNNSFGRYDFRVLSAFLKNIVYYYLDSTVKLSNGYVGNIVYIPPSNVTKPVVKIGNYYLDLSKNYSLDIAEMICWYEKVIYFIQWSGWLF